MNLSSALTSARSTVEAIVGQTGELFTAESVLHRAVIAIDPQARVPGSVPLFSTPEPQEIVLRLGTTNSAQPAIRTICLKFPDAYGPGRDQDFLLASSGDGAPLHHATLPVADGQPILYSSLWLYLAGVVPTLFGVRADSTELGEGDTAEFCVSAPVGRFRRIGTITVGAREDNSGEWTYSASHTGGNIRPLPPVNFY